MNDPSARLPESDAVLLRRRSQEVIDFPVLVQGARQVPLRPHFRTNQMVAMDRAGNRGLLLVGLHELQHGHLGRGILHRHAIGTQRQHGLPPLPILGIEVVGV